VEVSGFDRAMEEQRTAARKAWTGSGDRAEETIWYELKERAGATEFLGYGEEKAEGVVEALVVHGKEVGEAGAATAIAIVVNQTPFYAESGGQTGDRGTIATASGARVKVRDTVKRADSLHVHLGRVEQGKIKVGDAVELEIDHDRRRKL